MRALRFLEPEKFEVQQIARPEPKAGEVLLRVRGCGICGSDVHGWLGRTGRRLWPMTMGHEFSGEVAALGEGVSRIKPGDGVIVQPINFCGKCVNCQKGLTMLCLSKRFFGVLDVDGAMAEYVAVPEKLLYPLPERLKAMEGSKGYHIGAMAEPYAVAYGAVKKAGDLTGKDVLIVGAGMIGLCILQLVRLKNPAQIIVSDLSDVRLARALKLGANHTVNSRHEDVYESIAKYTDGRMIDTSFEAVGVEPTANQSVKALKIAGTAVWAGMSQREMTINMQDIVCSARNVLGTFNYTHVEFGEVVDILGSGRLETDALLSEVVSLENAADAFRRLHEQPDDLLKIVIDPTLQEAAL